MTTRFRTALTIFAIGPLFCACSQGTQWPIGEPPSAPLHLKSVAQLRVKAGEAMPQVTPTFNWPDSLRLQASGTIKQGAGSELWLDRRAETKYTQTITATPTSVGPIVTVENLTIEESSGSEFLVRGAVRELALDGNLAFRIGNNGRLNRVAGPENTVTAAGAAIAIEQTSWRFFTTPLPAITVAEVEERAKAVWTAWVENALGLVGSPTAGWCGKAAPPTLFVETDRLGEACLTLTAGSQCLIDKQTGLCFLVEYGLEIRAPEVAEHGPDPESQTPAAPPEAGTEPPGPRKVSHQSRARVLLAMESLVPVKVEVWRLTEVTEPQPGGHVARTWMTRHSLTRFRQVAAPPRGSARAKLQRSCAQGQAEDCFELGILVGTGKDGPKDHRAARQWVKKACDLAFAEACEFLTFMADATTEEEPSRPNGEPIPASD